MLNQSSLKQSSDLSFQLSIKNSSQDGTTLKFLGYSYGKKTIPLQRMSFQTVSILEAHRTLELGVIGLPATLQEVSAKDTIKSYVVVYFEASKTGCTPQLKALTLKISFLKYSKGFRWTLVSTEKECSVERPYSHIDVVQITKGKISLPPSRICNIKLEIFSEEIRDIRIPIPTQEIVYKGSSVAPQEVREKGLKLSTEENIYKPYPLYHHQAGFEDTPFKSTSRKYEIAEEFARDKKEGAQVYAIEAHPENAFDVNASLGEQKVHTRNEWEVAILGGVRKDQVLGWYSVEKEEKERTMYLNPEYPYFHYLRKK